MKRLVLLLPIALAAISAYTATLICGTPKPATYPGPPVMGSSPHPPSWYVPWGFDKPTVTCTPTPPAHAGYCQHLASSTQPCYVGSAFLTETKWIGTYITGYNSQGVPIYSDLACVNGGTFQAAVNYAYNKPGPCLPNTEHGGP